MKVQIKKEIVVSISVVMLLVFGIVGIGYTHESDKEHFHDESITLSVDENTPKGENIGEPLVVPNVDESTAYELRGTDADWFSFDPATRQLKTLGALNYEGQDSYAITVVVQRRESKADTTDAADDDMADTVVDDTTDAAGDDMADTGVDDTTDATVTDLYSINVTIKVNDVNDPPAFAAGNSATRSIDENTPANVNIGRPLRATDEDGDTLTYLLKGIGDSDNFVNLNEKTGRLTTRTDSEYGGFDYEAQSSYEVLVVASDGTDRSEIKVTIKINDVLELRDTNLRTAIKEALGVVDRELTQADMLGLTSLDASNSEISSLGDLQAAKNLRTLQLGKNNIRSDQLLHLSNLRRLTSLYLGGNEISDISALRNLTNIKRLGLANNDISDVTGLSTLTNLTTLRLDHNEIVDVEVLSELGKLTKLYLHNNAIANVEPLWNLSSLKALRLENNPIEWTAHLYQLEKKHGTEIDIEVSGPWDVNNDGVVDATDVGLVLVDATEMGLILIDAKSAMSDETQANGAAETQVDEESETQANGAAETQVDEESETQVEGRQVRFPTDVNFDGSVDSMDVHLVLDNLDDAAVAEAPLLFDTVLLKTLDPSALKMYLERLRAESDGSVKYHEAIAFLERMLSEMQPQRTILLANYPNPFNPETWIPYQLANPSNVEVTIYDARGSVVRRLHLGHQRAGYYTSRSRAAYWDGRNTVGERVGSGIYFYQLQADNVSLLRKMVILK